MRPPTLTDRRGGSAAVPHWPLAVRAAMVIVGLTLLLLVNVHDGAFYIAWSLIGLALASELAATLVHVLRGRRAHRER